MVLVLVAGIAIEGARTRTGGSSDGGTFKCATGLMADDAAGGGTNQTTRGGSALGVGSGWSTAAGKRENSGNGWKKHFDFHSDH